MNRHEIRMNDQPVEVERVNHNTFNVNLGNKNLCIQYKQDNEGADHWIDLKTNHETEETKAIGEKLEELFKG